MKVIKTEQGIPWLYIISAVILVTAFLSLDSKPEIDYVANNAACESQAKKVGAKDWQFDPLTKECRYK